MKSSLGIFAVTALAAGQLAQAAPVLPAVAARSLHLTPSIASTLQLRTPDDVSADQLLSLRTDGGVTLAELISRGALSAAEKAIDSGKAFSSLDDASVPASSGSSFSYQDATRMKLPAMDYKSAVRPKNDLAHPKKELARPTVPDLQSSEFPELPRLRSKDGTQVHEGEANTASHNSIEVPNKADPIYIPILHSLRPKGDRKARPTFSLNMASVRSDARPNSSFGISPGYRGLQENQELETMAAQERHVAWLLDSKDEAAVAHSPGTQSPGVKHTSSGSPPKLNAHAAKYKPASASPPGITHNAEAPYIPGRGFGIFPRKSMVAHFKVSQSLAKVHPAYAFELAEWQFAQRAIRPKQFLKAIRAELTRREFELRAQKLQEQKFKKQLQYVEGTDDGSKDEGKQFLREWIQQAINEQEQHKLAIEGLKGAIQQSTAVKMKDPWSSPSHSPKDIWTPLSHSLSTPVSEA